MYLHNQVPNPFVTKNIYLLANTSFTFKYTITSFAFFPFFVGKIIQASMILISEKPSDGFHHISYYYNYNIAIIYNIDRRIKCSFCWNSKWSIWKGYLSASYLPFLFYHILCLDRCEIIMWRATITYT